MSSKFVNSQWFKIRERLLGADPEENYIHYYYDFTEEYAELITNGGDVDKLSLKTFEALNKRNLLKLAGTMTTIQPDTWSYKYTVK